MAWLVAWLLWDVVCMNHAAIHGYFGSGDGTVVHVMYPLTLLEARQPSELVSQSLTLAVGGFFSL